ncbi:MAG: OmpA family protein [Bacteroidales bacterium]|nr:OmpA family protein [Bacteroidales bacterium]MBP5589830.1 OmpA family protein [Bacteroidales bacterium]
MKRFPFISFLMLIMAIGFSSCVSGRKYKTLEATSLMYMNERDDSKAESIQLSMANNELRKQLAQMTTQVSDIEKEYKALSDERDKARDDYARLNSRYNDLQRAQEQLVRGNAAETQRLLAELQAAQKSLQEKEGLMSQLERNLDSKKSSLDELSFELEKRNQRLLELEKILETQKSVVQDLKNKVSEALLGYENNGLTVSMKDGKVYVSLDEQLLFKSGSYNIDSKGKTALINLAKVLEKNNDIQISIEGHTDNVPYNGTGQLVDNWDLSVKRATTVVRVLLENSTINPKRLTASGRSEYQPIDNDNTSTARQKNRRTEVVLTPDLSGLYDVINNF